ncbi:MAG: HDOD domain-containing protein [Desulfobacteraceae bacterium]|nr:MAG: HDOD domain-containing protein [Desulfobacteraceae bacterium]
MVEAPLSKELRVKRVQNYIARMPSLSTTVTKVLEICNNPNASPNDLNRVITLDPVLAGKVLRLINSAYYSLPNKITSLTRAIIMLGINTVKNLALSTAIMESLGGRESFRTLPMDDFWTHSIGVGVLGKALAIDKGISAIVAEEYFVAGLLHDLGKIPLNNRFPEEYSKALESSRQKQSPLKLCEEEYLSIDHCIVGRMICERWQLSSAILETLAFHHSPEQAQPENHSLLSIVALANIYANVFEIGSSGDPFPDQILAMNLLTQLGMDVERVAGLKTKVLEEIERAKVFLQINESV